MALYAPEVNSHFLKILLFFSFTFETNLKMRSCIHQSHDDKN